MIINNFDHINCIPTELVKHLRINVTKFSIEAWAACLEEWARHYVTTDLAKEMNSRQIIFSPEENSFRHQLILKLAGNTHMDVSKHSDAALADCLVGIADEIIKQMNKG